MLMKRRKPPTWRESFRVWIWPRRSWLRSSQYVTKRILRLTATPHAVAAGVAAGAFTSFTPFMGLHFILAFVLAWLLRGNLLASALGTFVGNPVTFPFIWAATYQTGHFILGLDQGATETPALASAMADILGSLYAFDGMGALAGLKLIWDPILFPMLIGGTIVGTLFSVPLYFITRRTAGLFRESRKNKLMDKAAEIKSHAQKFSDATKGNPGANQA